jgi:two-component system OmpR family sensor kinase
MTIHSLRSKINLIFSVALILLVLLFAAILYFQEKKRSEGIVLQERAAIHYLYLYYLKTGHIDYAYLESQNIRLVTDKDIQGDVEAIVKSDEGTAHYRIVRYHYRRFIIVHNDRFHLLLENLNKPTYLLEMSIVFIGSLLLLLILYLWIIRSLQPLSELKEKIKTFRKGNLDIECHSDKKDEIAAVANEFDHAVKTIRELIRSRQLFLRAIMHELKTPIAKGRLVSEMIPNEKQKQRLERIFVRLNLLIDEFAKIEQLTSKNFHLELKPYRASKLLKRGIEMLMLDNASEVITTEIREDFTIQADIELLPLALKNLIDNALKYSPDHYAYIVVEKETIVISNKGEPLKEALERYFAPFHDSQGGLGLGLYIVKSILEIHQLTLDYTYENETNYFTVHSIRTQ